MLTTLNAVVQRLVDEYDPERVILFGSRASGRTQQDSDIDLMVVKDTTRRPIDRRIEVGRLLADRLMPLDVVVYTPRELWTLYRAGSPFIQDVLEHGRVLYMRNVTSAWLEDAEDELDTATLLFDHGKYRSACLHSQQAVEKALKALVLERGHRPARTHDVVDLLHAAVAEAWSPTLTTDDAVYLSSIYQGRYPTEEGLLPHGEPTLEDARRARDAAHGLVESVRDALGERQPLSKAEDHPASRPTGDTESRQDPKPET